MWSLYPVQTGTLGAAWPINASGFEGKWFPRNDTAGGAGFHGLRGGKLRTPHILLGEYTASTTAALAGVLRRRAAPKALPYGGEAAA